MEEEIAAVEQNTTDSNLQVVIHAEDASKSNPDEGKTSNPKEKDKAGTFPRANGSLGDLGLECHVPSNEFTTKTLGGLEFTTNNRQTVFSVGCEFQLSSMNSQLTLLVVVKLCFANT